MLSKAKSILNVKKAFTLIELLIVIAIIAILASMVYLNLNSARNRAKEARVKSDLSELSKALEVVKVDRDLTAVGWGLLNDTADNDSNYTRWDDIDGKDLVTALPANPFTDSTFGKTYRIRVLSGSGYALLGRLTQANKFWCVLNGMGREITGVADKENNISVIGDAQRDCDG